MNQVEQRISLVKSALGLEPLDVIIQNTRAINVFTGEIMEGGIGIRNGCVVACGMKGDFHSRAVVDGHHLFAIPGLIDTHVHIDSTLLTPQSLAEVIVPHGTTALFADPMEISNVAGYQGLKALFSRISSLPYHVFLEIPSRVPTAPGLETTGGSLGLEDVKKLLNWQAAISLGELDPSKIIGLQTEYFTKVEAALSKGKIANGHSAGLVEKELGVYACAGLADDHECTTYEEALARLRLGLAILIREGSTERNLEALITGILTHKADTRYWMMCTDDKHPNQIQSEGHINYMVENAIGLGMDPIQAIQMATINAAAHFRIDHKIGSLAPGRWADILLIPDLRSIQPEMVFFKGKLAAANGRLMTYPTKTIFPEWLYKTIRVTRGEHPTDFFLSAQETEIKVHVIEILPDQITNSRGEAVLPMIHGNVSADPRRDVLKLAVVERYGKNGNIGITFVKGFNLHKGAISSSVSHDHHNIVIAGVDETSMATCVRATVEMQGGLVVAVGKDVIARLPLPLGGLMSSEPSGRVIAQLDAINSCAQALGSTLSSPFMTLSFISLPTVPEFGLTDMGLIDVRTHQIISPFVDYGNETTRQ
jgi:adenine deaminase